MAINQKQDGDCGYIAAYSGRQVEVYAKTSFAASELARKHFNPPKSKRHLVSVHLCERPNGEQVTQVAT